MQLSSQHSKMAAGLSPLDVRRFLHQVEMIWMASEDFPTCRCIYMNVLKILLMRVNLTDFTVWNKLTPYLCISWFLSTCFSWAPLFRMKSCTFSVSLIKSRRPFVTFISLRSKLKGCAVLNDTFASVHVFRTFTHNMLAFGLSRKLCNDFLKKQAVIGNLNEGNTLLKITIGIKRQTHRALLKEALLYKKGERTTSQQLSLGRWRRLFKKSFWCFSFIQKCNHFSSDRLMIQSYLI